MTKSFVHQVRVPFADTDATGRIHFTSMFRNFEAAEAEFRRAIGFPYGQWESDSFSFPRVHAECDYTGPVGYDDQLRIAVSVERVGRSSYTISFAVTVHTRPVAHGKLVIACMDKQSQRSAPLPQAFAAALNEAWPAAEAAS